MIAIIKSGGRFFIRLLTVVLYSDTSEACKGADNILINKKLISNVVIIKTIYWW